MIPAILRFLRKSGRGQDLAEYCLLTALVALIALGIFYHVSGGIQNMWSTADSTLGAGNGASGANRTSASGDATASQPASR